jgi:hypothetical protein
MIRTVITADKKTLNLLLPDNFIGKQVEVIAFTLDEPVTQHKKHAAKDVFKALKLDTKGYKFDRDEANSR